jgi:hypothetical protein
VTTILSATKDKSGLDAWAERVGRDNAERIKNEAATVGTHMHNVIERMLAARDLPRPTTWLQLRGYEMGYRLINAYFCHLKEVWGSEVTVYYPGKYAGTTDLVGIYRDQPAIVDFKQSIKPKQAKWIQDYFHQLAAYAMAHDIVHGTSIEFAAVLCLCRMGRRKNSPLRVVNSSGTRKSGCSGWRTTGAAATSCQTGTMIEASVGLILVVALAVGCGPGAAGPG